MRGVSRRKMDDAISAIRSTADDGNQIQRRQPCIKPSKRRNAEDTINEEPAGYLPSKKRRIQAADSDAGNDAGNKRVSRGPPVASMLHEAPIQDGK